MYVSPYQSINTFPPDLVLVIALHTHTGMYATSEPRDESSDDGGGSNVTIPVVIAVG